jgi:hypothetical protein
MSTYQASIYLCPKFVNPIFNTVDGVMEDVKNHIDDYELIATIPTQFDDERGADEMFELTNSPWKIRSRNTLYGLYRSISVGDIVEISGVKFVCCPAGWSVF